MKGWTFQEIQFLVTHYPKKGKHWCANELERGGGAVRAKASELNLKKDINSEFFKSWQKAAAQSKTGKKRPLHSEIMKEKASENNELFASKFWNPRTLEMALWAYRG